MPPCQYGENRGEGREGVGGGGVVGVRAEEGRDITRVSEGWGSKEEKPGTHISEQQMTEG